MSNPVKINIDASYFNYKYLKYINRNERYQIFYGGAGSGKSYFLATKLVLKLLSEKHKLLVIRKTYASIEQSVYTEILNAIDNLKIRKFLKIKKSPFHIIFPNGSEIIFKGADDENKLLSISGITLCWVEEASEIDKELFNQLELRLRGGTAKKQFFLSFNPISATHWLKTEFFDNPKPDSFICHSTYLDNRFLDEEYVKTLIDLKIRNHQKYEVYALGKWGVMGKRVYDNWKKARFTINDVMKESKGKARKVFGMDFGYVADPTTLTCAFIDFDNRKIWIYDEMFEHGLLNNQIAERIIKKGYTKEIITADSAEQKSIAEIKKYGVPRIRPARKGGGSIMQGIQFLQQFEIIVHEDCVNTIEELENYSFVKDKKTGQYINKPVDKYNHIMDALRYAVEEYSAAQAGKTIKTLSKTMLGI